MDTQKPNFDFYDHKLANLGRLMDVEMNFLIAADSIVKDLPEDLKEKGQDLRDRISQCCQDLINIARQLWPIS